MKLFVDFFKFLAVFLFRGLWVILALLIVGFVWNGISQIKENPIQAQEKIIGEIQENLEKAQAAADRASGALNEATARLEEATQKADADRRVNDQRIAEGVGEQSALGLSLGDKLGEIGLSSEDFAVLDESRRVQTFISACEKYVGAPNEYCSAWVQDAQTLPGSSPESWHTKIPAAHKRRCVLYGDGRTAESYRLFDVQACTPVVAKKERMGAFGEGFSGAVTLYLKFELAQQKLADLRALVFEAPNALKDALTEAQEKNRQAIAARKVEEDNLKNAEKELERLKAGLANKVDEGAVWFGNGVKKYWFWAFCVVVVPFLLRMFAYFLAGAARRVPVFRLREDAASTLSATSTEGLVCSREVSEDGAEASVHVARGVRQPTITLEPGQTLAVRAKYVASSRGGSARFLLSRRYPLVSYAAGMAALTVFRGDQTRDVALSATTPGSHDEYIAKVTLKNHPGFIVRPARIIAVEDGLELRRRWNFGLSSWARLQFGYFYLSGTGVFYVAAPGGVLPRAIAVGESEEGREHLSQDLVLGWDGRLGVGFARNENWIEAGLLARQPLFESSLVGEGVYLQGHSGASKDAEGGSKLLTSMLDVLLKAMGIG